MKQRLEVDFSSKAWNVPCDSDKKHFYTFFSNIAQGTVVT